MYDLARLALVSIDQRIKAREMLERGVATYDSVLLDKVDTLAAPWIGTKCPFHEEKDVQRMVVARRTIEEEVAKLKDLVVAVQSKCARHGPSPGRIGDVVLDDVDPTEIKNLLDGGFSSTKPVTATGIHTLEVAKFTVTLRTFLVRVRDNSSPPTTWEDVKSLMDEVDSGRLSVPAEIGHEIECVQSEILAREMTLILIKKLTASLPKNGLVMDMLCGVLSFNEMEVEELSDLIQGCLTEQELNGVLRNDLQ